jgi:hypothetical protein
MSQIGFANSSRKTKTLREKASQLLELIAAFEMNELLGPYASDWSLNDSDEGIHLYIYIYVYKHIYICIYT